MDARVKNLRLDLQLSTQKFTKEEKELKSAEVRNMRDFMTFIIYLMHTRYTPFLFIRLNLV